MNHVYGVWSKIQANGRYDRLSPGPAVVETVISRVIIIKYQIPGTSGKIWTLLLYALFTKYLYCRVSRALPLPSSTAWSQTIGSWALSGH